MLAIEPAGMHIQITMTCCECGHEWDIEDYDSLSVDFACTKAMQLESCPRCTEAD